LYAPPSKKHERAGQGIDWVEEAADVEPQVEAGVENAEERHGGRIEHEVTAR